MHLLVLICFLLMILIQQYYLASGQQVNFHKSSVFSGANVFRVLAKDLGRILGMLIVNDPETYLGIPVMWGRSKRKCLNYVKERILGKLQRWKQATLS